MSIFANKETNISFKLFVNNLVSIAMNYNEIYKALHKQGLTWGISADAIGCSSSHLMNVASRRAESKTVALKLAALVQKDVAEVFPDIPRYKSDAKSDRQARIDKAKARLAEAGLAEAI